MRVFCGLRKTRGSPIMKPLIQFPHYFMKPLETVKIMSETTITAAQALKCLSGISKKRLYQMMKNGDISYSLEPWGNKTRRVIDASELARVFGSKYEKHQKTETKQDTVSSKKTTLLETTNTTLETKLLEQENKMLHEQVNELREERNDWKQQAQTLLLQSPQKLPERKKGFFNKIFGS